MWYDKRVVICGSVKVNVKYMCELANKIRSYHGYSVIEPLDVPFHRTHDSMEKSANIKFYYDAIRSCDVVIVYSDNHIGFETACEIGYALAHHKKLYFTHKSDIDGVRALLVDGIAELFKMDMI